MSYCIYCMNEIGDDAVCPVCHRTQAGIFPAHHLQPGTVLQGKYVIGAALGEGGFGITYIGKNLYLDLTVAIKEYFPNGYVTRATAFSKDLTCISNDAGRTAFEKGKQRFLEEAKILAKFSGEEGVVSVHDLFEDNNTAYIVMEYLEGVTLKAYLDQKKRLTPEESLALLKPVTHTLGRIHKAGLIHRDISPDNIMILADGKVKLLDFGAARDVSGDASLSVLLKHGYAPEEQYRRKGQQGPWTDIYALCATIYKCVTGVTPDDSSERVVNDQLLPPSSYITNIDPVFEAALMKGLGVFAQNRYQTVEELLEGFEGRDATLAAAGAYDPDKTVYGGGAEVPPEDPDKTVYGGEPEPKTAPEDPDKTVYSETPYFCPATSEETPAYTGAHTAEQKESKEKSKNVLRIVLISVAVLCALAFVIIYLKSALGSPDPVPHTSEESAGTVTHTSKDNVNSLPGGSAQESSTAGEISAEPSAPEESIIEESLPETSVQEESIPEPSMTEESSPEESITEESSAEAHVHGFGEWTVVKEATCTEDGMKERVCSCGEKQTESITALGHNWGAPGYSWSSDLSKVTATCTCSRDGSHKLTETASTTSSVTKAATCEAIGTKTYTATFINSTFAKQTKTEAIAALGHNWGAPSYSWNSDLSKVTATCTCSRDGSHKLTENVSTTSSVTKAATCEGTGTKTYTATFKNTAFSKQTKTVTISALGHKYDNGVCVRCGNKQPSSGLEFSDSGSGYAVSGIGSCTDKALVIPSAYNGKPVTSIDGGAFYDCSGLTSITIPGSVTSIGDYAFAYCSSLTSVTIPDSVTWIGHYAFLYCSSLVSVTIPDSVTWIGDWAFQRCSSLTSITIPDSVTSIGDHAFYECSNLTSVTIPDSVTSIGDYVFAECSSLTSVTIPDGVTSIGELAFYECSNLTNVTIPYGVTSIGELAFQRCSNLTSITIPESVTSIGDQAFLGCDSLTSVTIPGSVTSIGRAAFSSCRGLTTVTIGSGVTSIGDRAFSDCRSLKSITIPGSVTSIGYAAFAECSSLTSIKVNKNNPVYHSSGNCVIETESKTLVLGFKNSVIPSDGSVTSIGSGAFSDCSGLTSVTIPESVTSIGRAAFSGCFLYEINFTGTKTQWNSISKDSKWNEGIDSYVVHCTDGDIKK